MTKKTTNKVVDVLKTIESSRKKANFTVTKLSDPKTLARVDQWISTGCLPLDHILGGGYAVRRITEIYGDNSTGKTLLAIEASIETQEMGGLVVFADAEIAMSVERMIALGVDPDKLIYANVDTIGDVFALLDSSIEAKNKHYGKEAILTFVIDSVAALAIKEDFAADHDYEAKEYPRVAAVMSKALRAVPGKISKNNVCLILINQTRQKLGVMFGDGVVTTGGKAIRFYASLRLELQSRSKITDSKKKNVLGVNATVRSVKNKLAPPYRTITLPIYYDWGIDEELACFDYLLANGLITNYVDDEGKVKKQTYMFNGNNKLTFTKKKFRDVFEDKYDEIAEMIKKV